MEIYIPLLPDDQGKTPFKHMLDKGLNSLINKLMDTVKFSRMITDQDEVQELLKM